MKVKCITQCETVKFPDVLEADNSMCLTKAFFSFLKKNYVPGKYKRSAAKDITPAIVLFLRVNNW